MLARKKVKTQTITEQKMEEEVKTENNRLMEEETKPDQKQETAPVVQNETIIITTITSGSDNSNVQVSTTMTQDQVIINPDVPDSNPEIK
jgi:hypothetical protein